MSLTDFSELIVFDPDTFTRGYPKVSFIVVVVSLVDPNTFFGDLMPCQAGIFFTSKYVNTVKCFLDLNSFPGASTAIVGFFSKGELVDGDSYDWDFRVIAKPAIGDPQIPFYPRTYGDCLGEIKSHLRDVVPAFPRCNPKERMLLPRKGKDFPFTEMMAVCPEFQEYVLVGLGWDTGEQSIDLDASICLFDEKLKLISVLYYGNKEMPGLLHYGDNTTGTGDYYDEVMKLEINKLNSDVAYAVVCITSFRGDKFSSIENAYCELQNSKKDTFLRYDLDELGNATGLAVGGFRKKEGKWSFFALGEMIEATMPTNCPNQVSKLLKKL